MVLGQSLEHFVCNEFIMAAAERIIHHVQEILPLERCLHASTGWLKYPGTGEVCYLLGLRSGGDKENSNIPISALP